jgi:hypothetical protein
MNKYEINHHAGLNLSFEKKLAINQRMHGSILSPMRGDILSEKGLRIDRMSATCINSALLIRQLVRLITHGLQTSNLEK